MTNKYTRKCSTSSAIKEIQIKATLRFHLTPLEWQSSRKQMTSNADKDVFESGGDTHTLLVECKLEQPLQKSVWRLLKN
jgi:hypothetical protein